MQFDRDLRDGGGARRLSGGAQDRSAPGGALDIVACRLGFGDAAKLAVAERDQARGCEMTVHGPFGNRFHFCEQRHTHDD